MRSNTAEGFALDRDDTCEIQMGLLGYTIQPSEKFGDILPPDCRSESGSQRGYVEGDFHNLNTVLINLAGGVEV